MTDQKKTQGRTSNLDRLLKMVNSLDEEQQEQLRKAGAVFPMGATEETITNPKYGYWCCYCNNIALYFIGEKFIGPNGREVKVPLPNTSLDLHAWSQNLPAKDIKRPVPNCQVCNARVVLDGPKRTLRDKYVREIDAHEAMLAKVADPEWQQNLRDHLNNLHANFEGVDVSAEERANLSQAEAAANAAPDMGADGERSIASTPMSQRLTPQQVADLNALYPAAQEAAQKAVESGNT